MKKIYLIVTDVTCDNMRTIKMVYPHPDGQHYILRADNPTYKGNTVIPVSSVLKIFIVKGHFSRKQL